MTNKELVQAIQNQELAGYIANNYWHMDKDDLMAIAIQLIFTMYDNGLTVKAIDINELLERLDLD